MPQTVPNFLPLSHHSLVLALCSTGMAHFSETLERQPSHNPMLGHVSKAIVIDDQGIHYRD